ncbi:hypothetical protein CDAR_462511 [Caerostris darwini]|uniref:Uncharacterized protein n=1 Tax=Caerostris darwini TaxID=1538125 RepID=A0AAV4WQM1_9ARAC|nr:hypothetical protein CDAR_462511 [Caerostris darwini]
MITLLSITLLKLIPIDKQLSGVLFEAVLVIEKFSGRPHRIAVYVISLVCIKINIASRNWCIKTKGNRGITAYWGKGILCLCLIVAHRSEKLTAQAMDFHMTWLLQQLRRIWECSRDSYRAPFHRIIGSRSICSAPHFHGAAIDVQCEDVTEGFEEQNIIRFSPGKIMSHSNAVVR